MAHTCPDCGQTCYCGGDIDDCEFNFEEDVINCTHYLTPENFWNWWLSGKSVKKYLNKQQMQLEIPKEETKQGNFGLPKCQRN